MITVRTSEESAASPIDLSGLGIEASRRHTWMTLVVFCFLLFGWSLWGGRPLTMHEAVLPQSAKEMLMVGEWVVPTSGGRPWLERPPLPQWIVATTMKFAGRTDSVAIVRLPSVIAATAVVLLTGWMASTMFGFRMGWMSAALLATSFEFVSYAWLAEQDIYLCLLTSLAMAAFIRLEFAGCADPERHGFLGGRSAAMTGFFLLLGATNLAKGLLFGTAMVLIPVFGYFAWTRFESARRYLWLWGWLSAACVAMAWPLAAYRRYPDVVDLWLFDLVGRLNGTYAAINQPWWHYGPALAGALLPWTPFAIVGSIHLLQFHRGGDRSFGNGARLVLSWSIVPVVVFSFAGGKHHHYLLPVLPAWAMVSAAGLSRVAESARRRFGVQIHIRHVAGTFIAVAATYVAIHSLALPGSDQCASDTQFFRMIADGQTEARPNEPIFVNADVGSMDSFRMLFYLRNRGRLIHSMDYLIDEKNRRESAYVLTRRSDERLLDGLGEVRILASSSHSRRESSPADRFTLFEVRFRPDLVWRELPGRISPMQAMGRK